MTAADFFAVTGALLLLACGESIALCIKAWLGLGIYMLTTRRKNKREIAELQRQIAELKGEQ